MTKEYVGVKLVTAWPQDGKDGQPGYAVKYEDGYTSWSPKDVFEAAYAAVGLIRSTGKSWNYPGAGVSVTAGGTEFSQAVRQQVRTQEEG